MTTQTQPKPSASANVVLHIANSSLKLIFNATKNLIANFPVSTKKSNVNIAIVSWTVD